MSFWSWLYAQPEGFACYWNAAEFPYDKPIVIEFDKSVGKAMVAYNGLLRALDATFEAGRAPGYREPDPDKLMVKGFAAQFRTGRVLWNASIDFLQHNGVWHYSQTYLFGVPHSKGPATIIGFLEDYPPRQRGTGGYREMIEDRARAGQKGGPRNAAEVGRYWERRDSEK